MIFGRNAKFRESEVSLPGNVSSQFISALLLVAHHQPDGLRIRITGEVMSRPYIEMTLELLSRFGIMHRWEGDTISIPRQHLQAGTYAVEADWSSASYWFCIAALAGHCEIRLHGLRPDSLQGDQAVAGKMADLGVLASWRDGAVTLTRGHSPAARLHWDFADCPDLAQGLIVAAAALGVEASFTGLQSLRIKETDRIAALQAELMPFGVNLMENDGKWWLEGSFLAKDAEVRTYEDHRMAMAFAPLALRCPHLVIQHPEVVAKSYPGFWEDLRKVGFRLGMQ
jgi:3-phosphoshikimate 1-carboxyvinyltransferase